MSSTMCALSMYSRLCMKMSSFLFVLVWTMQRILYLSCGIPNDKYDICGIFHACTNRNDDIFMQRRLYIDKAHMAQDIFSFAVISFFVPTKYNIWVHHPDDYPDCPGHLENHQQKQPDNFHNHSNHHSTFCTKTCFLLLIIFSVT